jgi:hypothetical protein
LLTAVTVTVTVTGNLLNTKALTLVSRPVQSPNDMLYRPPGTKQSQWSSVKAICMGFSSMVDIRYGALNNMHKIMH